MEQARSQPRDDMKPKRRVIDSKDLTCRPSPRQRAEYLAEGAVERAKRHSRAPLPLPAAMAAEEPDAVRWVLKLQAEIAQQDALVEGLTQVIDELQERLAAAVAGRCIEDASNTGSRDEPPSATRHSS
jgi:hypothetical protein